MNNDVIEEMTAHSVTASDDPEEGEVFGLLDFHLTITSPEE